METNQNQPCALGRGSFHSFLYLFTRIGTELGILVIGTALDRAWFKSLDYFSYHAQI